MSASPMVIAIAIAVFPVRYEDRRALVTTVANHRTAVVQYYYSSPHIDEQWVGTDKYEVLDHVFPSPLDRQVQRR